MVEYKILLGYVAVAIALLAYGLYLRSIFKGRTKPHAFSWLLWGVLTGMIFVAQMLKGGGAGGWVTGVSSIVCFIIGFSALYVKDERGFSVFDWTFLAIATVALLSWLFTKNPTYSVVLVTFIDVLGYGSTLKKGYTKPHEEMITSFALNSLKYAVALFALQSYSVATWLYPAALVFMNGLVAAMVAYRRTKIHIRT